MTCKNRPRYDIINVFGGTLNLAHCSIFVVLHWSCSLLVNTQAREALWERALASKWVRRSGRSSTAGNVYTSPTDAGNYYTTPGLAGMRVRMRSRLSAVCTASSYVVPTMTRSVTRSCSSWRHRSPVIISTLWINNDIQRYGTCVVDPFTGTIWYKCASTKTKESLELCGL